MNLNVWADSGYIWVWTDKSEQEPGTPAGQIVPKLWIDKGYVKQEIDRAQVDIFDLMGG